MFTASFVRTPDTCSLRKLKRHNEHAPALCGAKEIPQSFGMYLVVLMPTDSLLRRILVLLAMAGIEPGHFQHYANKVTA
jgi:hypothetical protein